MIIDKVASILGGNVGDGVSKIVDSVSKFFNTPEEKQAFETKKAEITLAVTQEMNRHDEANAALIEKEFETQIADMANARAMQIAALQQDDKLAKRFIYYLAAFFILLVMSFDFCLFWVTYPEQNRDVIMTLIGVLNSGGLIMILSFFFGSSSNSKSKDETIKNLSQQ